MYKQKVWCLVPAAGLGSRLDAGTPKQYIDLLGIAYFEICHHNSRWWWNEPSSTFPIISDMVINQYFWPKRFNTTICAVYGFDWMLFYDIPHIYKKIRKYQFFFCRNSTLRHSTSYSCCNTGLALNLDIYFVDTVIDSNTFN